MFTTKRKENTLDKRIYKLGVGLSLIFIFMAVSGFMVLLLPIISDTFDFKLLGPLGDTVGGFLNPLIAISAALLTFLAFYIQYKANFQVQQQFIFQQVEGINNFKYDSFRKRIELIIKEIESFEISFHGGKLISSLDELNLKGKKYNFNGIQGLNLFLLEYFRDKEEKENSQTKNTNLNDSYHSVMLGVINLIILFYSTFKDVQESKIDENYKNELDELLTYVYHSKVSFLSYHFQKNGGPTVLMEKVKELFDFYNINQNS